jgi:hypothetical protein
MHMKLKRAPPHSLETVLGLCSALAAQEFVRIVGATSPSVQCRRSRRKQPVHTTEPNDRLRESQRWLDALDLCFTWTCDFSTS